MVGEVVSVGRINIDVDLRMENLPEVGGHVICDKGQINFGGSASNFASQCSRLGLKVSLVSCVGNDAYGSLAVKEIAKLGIDTSCVMVLDNQPTGIFVMARDSTGKQMVMAEPGANRFLDRRVFEDDSIAEAHVMHIAGAFPMMIDRAMEMTSTYGMVLSLDPGRAAEGLDFSRILRGTDLLFLNQEELKEYFGIEPRETELKNLAKTFPGVLIVKMGKKGAIATDGFEFVSSKIFEVKVADTMGAGDAFAAGFVTAWTRAEDISKALHFANAVAAITITKPGAQNGQPDLDETNDLLRSHGIQVDSIVRTFKKGPRPKKARRSK